MHDSEDYQNVHFIVIELCYLLEKNYQNKKEVSLGIMVAVPLRYSFMALSGAHVHGNIRIS